MPELLFLCHRLPYPPDKGDKIRAYNWLRALASQYRVHLGTFIDDPADWSHRQALNELCETQCIRPLPPRLARARSLVGLYRNEPLTFAAYRDRVLARWVAELMHKRPIESIVVFSSGMGPYATPYNKVSRVLDFVDVDSDKWRQYARHANGPMRWVYAREAAKLEAKERRLASLFDASVFVSDAEAALFRRLAPESAARVTAIPNGVDGTHFNPGVALPDPYEGRTAKRIVFTGAMDYAANVDAVVWFAESVLPRIRETAPDAVFSIVGKRPTRRVLALAEKPGVHVAGAVADTRPYLRHAAVAIAPMRIARGIQNKVLEAFAMGRPVVMTSQARAGLHEPPTEAASVADQPEAFAAAVQQVLGAADGATHNHAARAYALAHYGWLQRYGQLLSLLNPGGADLTGAAA